MEMNVLTSLESVFSQSNFWSSFFFSEVFKPSFQMDILCVLIWSHLFAREFLLSISVSKFLPFIKTPSY